MQGAQEIRGEGDRRLSLRSVVLGEIIKQQRNVADPLAQSGRIERQHIKPVIQVFAEAAGGNFRLEVTVGRGDHPHVDRYRTRGTHRVNGALLQYPQQLNLQFQRQIADFVQEDGATVGQFKSAHPVGNRTGEGALAMAKKFALQQFLWNGSAIDRDEISAGPVGLHMQRACDDLLAGAALTGDQHRRVRHRDNRNDVADGPHRVALADESRHAACAGTAHVNSRTDRQSRTDTRSAHGVRVNMAKR